MHSMGNLIPCIVFEEVEDEEDDYEISEADSDISLRTKQLMEIREVNLRRQRSGNSLLQYHGTNAIVEDAALEDLCGEAGCEADNIENDNGALSAEQKAAMLDKLAKNNQTKKHFQSKQTLQNYLDTKLYGDEKTDNFLGLGPSNSRYQSASNQGIITENNSDKEPVQKKVTKDPRKFSEGNTLTIDMLPPLNRNTSGISMGDLKRENSITIPMKTMHGRTSDNRDSVAQRYSKANRVSSQTVRGSYLRNHSQMRASNFSRQSSWSRASRMTNKDRTSQVTAYSLPGRLTSTVPRDDMKRVSKILRHNEETILIAEQVAQGKTATKKNTGCLRIVIAT